LTYDQGKEMSRHAELDAQTGARSISATRTALGSAAPARTPRQYMPKGTDLSLFSQDELDGIADSMNNRPRATHAWHTPLEVFAQTLASPHQPPASIQ
jgi:IS30 family transposase